MNHFLPKFKAYTGIISFCLRLISLKSQCDSYQSKSFMRNYFKSIHKQVHKINMIKLLQLLF